MTGRDTKEEDKDMVKNKPVNVMMDNEEMEMLDNLELKNLPRREVIVKTIAKKGYGRGDKVRALINNNYRYMEILAPILKGEETYDVLIEDILEEYVEKVKK
jgi:hypothetical protein